MNYTFRKATSSDMLTISSTAQSTKPAKVYYAMIDEMDKVVGFAGLTKLNWNLTDLRHLHVIDGCRRKGLGKELVEKVTAECHTPLIYATVMTDNTASLKCFEHAGYRVTDTITNPTTGNVLHVLMKKLS